MFIKKTHEIDRAHCKNLGTLEFPTCEIKIIHLVSYILVMFIKIIRARIRHRKLHTRHVHPIIEAPAVRELMRFGDAFATSETHGTSEVLILQHSWDSWSSKSHETR